MPPLDPKSIPIGLPWCREEDYDAFAAIFGRFQQLAWNLGRARFSG